MKLKWCVIGAGGIADRRAIPALLKDEKSELVAIMDRNLETAKRIGEKYGVPYFLCNSFRILQELEDQQLFFCYLYYLYN